LAGGGGSPKKKRGNDGREDQHQKNSLHWPLHQEERSRLVPIIKAKFTGEGGDLRIIGRRDGVGHVHSPGLWQGGLIFQESPV